MPEQQTATSDWPAFAGIDWGGSEHQLCVLTTTGARLTQQRVTHNVVGLTELDTALAQHGTALPIAVERAEGILVEHLQARGHSVFAVSPRIAARARERYRVAAVKDDRLDAFVLADTLRHEHPHWRALTPPSPLLAEIRALTRDRDRLQQIQQATESQLRAILEAITRRRRGCSPRSTGRSPCTSCSTIRPRRPRRGSRPPA